jgi:hypothetical protein
MNKKIVLAAALTIIVFGVGISISQSLTVQEKYSKVFHLDATFYADKKYVEIIFSDDSAKTNGVVLEILGMETSFQKTFEGSNFKITVPFDGEPTYGWKTMPVTLVVDHLEFGQIGIKTDIHEEGKESHVIFTEL